MKNNNDIQACRVCGVIFPGYFPWGKEGNSSSYDICHCCFNEFGADDYYLGLIRLRRYLWLQNGATWYYDNEKPENWDLLTQLGQIPLKYI